MPPFLAQLLDDPYDAVRLVAGRSLKAIPAFHDFKYDPISPPRTRRDVQLRAMALWDRTRDRTGPPDPRLLMGDAGVNVEAVLQLLKQRDNRRILMRE
jgi:hypothetical protein